MHAATLKRNCARWSFSAALLVAVFAAGWSFWHPRALKIRLSVVDVWDIHEFSATNPDATCAVILQVENLDSSELMFADGLKAQARVGSHWLEPADLLGQVKTLGLRVQQGAHGKLAVAAPPDTEAVRLFLRARHPALIERARWFLIDKSSSLESKVNWRWLHLHLPVVPGWRRAECEVALPPSLRPPNLRHNPAAPGNGAMASLSHAGRLGGAVPEPHRWAESVQ